MSAMDADIIWLDDDWNIPQWDDDARATEEGSGSSDVVPLYGPALQLSLVHVLGTRWMDCMRKGYGIGLGCSTGFCCSC